MKLKNLERVSNCKNKERLACLCEQSNLATLWDLLQATNFTIKPRRGRQPKGNAGEDLAGWGNFRNTFPWPRFCQGLSSLPSLLTVLRISTFDAQLLCNLNNLTQGHRTLTTLRNGKAKGEKAAASRKRRRNANSTLSKRLILKKAKENN